MEERDNRAGCLVDDLLDQLERMLRARAETDERNVRLFARRYESNLADLDLGGDHLVPEVGNKGRNPGQAVLALVRDEYAEAPHLYVSAVDANA